MRPTSKELEFLGLFGIKLDEIKAELSNPLVAEKVELVVLGV